MSERHTYAPGVPCWVEAMAADPATAQRFYAALLGWEIFGTPGYAVARTRGLDVAGIGLAPEPGTPAAWFTHIKVENADATADRVAAAGGTVLHAAFDVAPAGRLAVVTDPAGATFCLWQAGVREGAQVVNEPGAWAMSALQTDDPKAAAAFYGAVFGWQAQPMGPMTLLRLPGYVGGEPQQPVPRDVVAVIVPSTAGAAGWGVDFWVSDTDAIAGRAEQLGGAVVMAPFDRPLFRSALLADPEGATFSISQLVGAPS
jgi:predicted enzyme related to lactoylglutathione lyase